MKLPHGLLKESIQHIRDFMHFVLRLSRMSIGFRCVRDSGCRRACCCRGVRDGRGRRRDSPRRAPLGLRVHEPRDARHAGRRHHQSGSPVGARRRGAVGAPGRRCRKGVRRLPRRRPREHEGRGGALPGVGRGERAAGQPGAAHQRLPQQPPAIAGACVREQGAPCAHRLARAPVARSADCGPGRRADEALPGSRARDVQSPSGTVEPRLRALPRRALEREARRHQHHRRGIRPATRSTGSNGRRSGRSSAGCATA